jgi:methylenetetrahydrofolate dehydrogenase (NADP+)/methenyltetrahydrofolate cyclohydrolase
MSQKLSGTPVAEAIYQELRAVISSLPKPPSLRVVRVGEDPASVSYVRLKDRQARKLGLESQVLALPEQTSEAELLALIRSLNEDPQVDGILVQAPLPPHLSFTRVLEALDPEKDVDGLTPVNTGRLWMGESILEPCTPAGIMRLLAFYGLEVAGREVLIINRSTLVGKPLAAMMLRKDATVTLAHSKSLDLPALARRAEIVVSAVGRPGFLTEEFVRPGAVLIDVSVNRVGKTPEGKDLLVGDATPEAIAQSSAWTPVPGGVGPTTVAMLLANTVRAAARRYAPALV